MQLKLIVATVGVVGLAACGTPAENPDAGASAAASAVESDEGDALPAVEPELVTTTSTTTTTTIPPTTTEPLGKGRPVIVEQGEDAVVNLPPGPDGERSSMTLRIVRLEDEVVPFLEIDSAAAVAPVKADDLLWIIEINGSRENKFGVDAGGVFGIRLSDELVDAGFTVSIWTETIDGERMSDPVAIGMEMSS
ncbi:MAG: hypothetical protein LH471_05690 [Salinibacterium sp.]|nr:hypothetical protein [Salinibacterium sp.]